MHIEILIAHVDLRRMVLDSLAKRGITINLLQINYNFEREQLVLEVIGEPLPEPAAPAPEPVPSAQPVRALSGWII